MIMKGILTLCISSLMTFLAYVSYHYNVLGGKAFTATDEEQQLWAMTFLALTLLQIVFGFIVSAMPTKKQRSMVYGLIGCLIFISVAGGFSGRILSTAPVEAESAGNKILVDGLNGAVDAQNKVNIGIANGLANAASSSSSSTRVAAYDRAEELKQDIDKSLDNSREAAEIAKKTKPTASTIFGELKGPFFIILSFTIELGMSILSWLLSKLFLRDISNVIQVLTEKEKVRKTDDNTDDSVKKK